MKKLTAFTTPFILFLFFVPFCAGAQKDVSGIPIPMKQGILFYENSYTSNAGTNGRDLYTKALNWFAKTFPGSNKQAGSGDAGTGKGRQAGDVDYAHTNIDAQSPGSITRKETFKVLTGDTSVNYYYITVTMHVDVRDGAYTFQVYNFYEKPIQKGITNDYSKIEYRWRDFRNGKPWVNTDKALFTGLNDQTLAYIDSFHKEMANL